MDTDVLELVGGIPIAELQLRSAIVQDYRQCEVVEESYPVLVPSEASTTTGVLISGLDVKALERILFFEGEEYQLQHLDTVTDAGEQVSAYYFCDKGAYTVQSRKWDFDQWVLVHKASFIDASRQYMALFGKMSAAEADDHWNTLTGNNDGASVVNDSIAV